VRTLTPQRRCTAAAVAATDSPRRPAAASQAVLKHGTECNTDLKVLCVGLSEAGKTSLINGIIMGSSHVVRQGETASHALPIPHGPLFAV